MTSVTVGGAPAEFDVTSDHLLQVTVPELPAGTHPIMLSGPFGTNDPSDVAEIDLVTLGPGAPPAPAATGAPPSRCPELVTDLLGSSAYAERIGTTG